MGSVTNATWKTSWVGQREVKTKRETERESDVADKKGVGKGKLLKGAAEEGQLLTRAVV
jgi:hypothetical protein